MATVKALTYASEGYTTPISATADELTVAKITLVGLAGIALDGGGARLANIADPTSSQDAATKAYVDSAVAGFFVKEPVRVASLGNIALSSPGPAIDGVSLVAGDRVLVKDQSTGSENGIYVWNGAALAMTRSPDADVSAEMKAGLSVFVNEGTQADTTWVITTNNPIVLNTTAITFTQFAGLGSLVAGNGLTKASNTIDVGAGNGIAVAADSIAVDLAASAGLEFSSAKLRVKVEASSPTLLINGSGELAAKLDASGGIEVTSSGLRVKLNGATLSRGASGMAVLGLPSLFTINGVAVGANVTSANLDGLVNGGNADALHTHAIAAAEQLQTNDFTASENLALGDPVYISGVGTVGKARADTVSKSRVIGICTAVVTTGNPVNIAAASYAANVLAGATANTPYYLGATGGLTTTPLTTPGSRNILIGYAITTTHLWVRVTDYGQV